MIDQIDLSPIGVEQIWAVTHFRDGLLLVAADHDRALVLNTDGELLFEFDYREKLGILNPGGLTEIDSGPWAGALAMIDGSSAEIVIFSLD